MSVLKAPETGRFYDKNGNCQLTVPKADGKGERDPTITDARKNHWYPSVNEVLKRLASPELDMWKVEHLIDTARQRPQNVGESDEDYIKFIYEASKEYVTLAASMGKDIHADLFEFFINGKVPTSTVSLKACQNVQKILEEYKVTLVRGETSFCNTILGWAGRSDMDADTKTGGTILIDFKTTTEKSLKELKWAYYKSGLQLAGYRLGKIMDDRAACLNIHISRETGSVRCYNWCSNESPYSVSDLGVAFGALFTEWCISNKYDPRKAA